MIKVFRVYGSPFIFSKSFLTIQIPNNEYQITTPNHKSKMEPVMKGAGILFKCKQLINMKNRQYYNAYICIKSRVCLEATIKIGSITNHIVN